MKRGLLIRLGWFLLVWSIAIPLFWALRETDLNAMWLFVGAMMLQALMTVVLPGFEGNPVRLMESDAEGASSGKPDTLKRRNDLDALGFTHQATVQGINMLGDPMPGHVARLYLNEGRTVLAKLSEAARTPIVTFYSWVAGEIIATSHLDPIQPNIEEGTMEVRDSTLAEALAQHRSRVEGTPQPIPADVVAWLNTHRYQKETS